MDQPLNDANRMIVEGVIEQLIPAFEKLPPEVELAPVYRPDDHPRD